MRDPTRIPRILAKLQAYWEANPDVRLGQIVMSLAPTTIDMFYAEDEVLEANIPEVPRRLNKPGGIPLEQEKT